MTGGEKRIRMGVRDSRHPAPATRHSFEIGSGAGFTDIPFILK
jgi:hypothetical protein